MRPYFILFPQGTPVETRSIFARGAKGLPDGQYRFVEFYCDEPHCDCQRVIVQVWDEKNTPLATFTFGWESPGFYAKWSKSGDLELAKEMASATPEPLGPQSQYTSSFFPFFENATRDPVYLAKLRRHYSEFRTAVQAHANARKKRRGTAASKAIVLSKKKVTSHHR